MPYTPMLGTLGYVLSPDRKRALLVHRIARKDDHHLGKYSGLGGKMEPNEDVATCMKREILEEAGIECLHMELRGTLSWPGFGPNGQDWLGFIFLITQFSGEPLKENVEGRLEWVPIEKICDLPMWKGDRLFIPLIFDQDPRPFHGYMPYKDGEPVGWSYVRL